jgi:hypothetical protein
VRARFAFLGVLLLVVAAVLAAASARAASPAPAGSSAGIRTPKALSQPMRQRSDRSAQAAKLRLTEPLVLSTTSGKSGEPIYATARIKNVSDQPVAIKWLVAAGRGPDIPEWDCRELPWSQCGADFGGLSDFTLAPGEELAYREVRVPSLRGGFWTEMVYQDAGTLEWHTPEGSNRVAYSVSGGELRVIQPLQLAPASARPGQPVVATARVKNVGDGPLTMRYLTAAGRGPGIADWDCLDVPWEECIADFLPAEDLVLQPGEEYGYVGLTAGRRRGAYFAELAYLDLKTDQWLMGLRGSSRVQYELLCDARCQMVTRQYREVVGREPAVEDLRAAYDAPWDEAGLRGYLCGRAERRAGVCGGAPASAGIAQRLIALLPLGVR